MFGLRPNSADEDTAGATISITRPGSTQVGAPSTAKPSNLIGAFVGEPNTAALSKDTIQSVCMKERRSMLQINNQRMLKVFKKGL